MNINYDEYSTEDIKNGWYYDAITKAHHCLICGAVFAEGEVFPIAGRFYLPSQAVCLHIELEHGGMFSQLISTDSKYSSLTDKQQELLSLMQRGMTDAEIASKLGITASTVRHQRFSFREKAKQAKLYLAQYELALQAEKSNQDILVPIHDGAKMVDERFVITREEREKTIATVFSNLSPLKLKLFSAKEKKKIITLQKIIEQFEKGRIYPEKEVNQILKEIYDDYPTLRRYLIEYGFMGRSSDCKEYWVI